jgi:AcrR family transcriptional regulator
MTTSRTTLEAEPTGAAPPRRRYDSTRRQESAAETRRKILAAGSELLKSSNVRDWGGLTVRAVAERTGVHERTVYRHFTNERGLRDAVMRQVEEEAGIVLEGMDLDEVSVVARRILEHVSAYPVAPRPALDATLSEANQRQHQALLDAVAGGAGGWSAEQCVAAAAMLDVLWSVAAYERLVRDWQLERDEAISAVGWVIAMVVAAIQHGTRPSNGSAS